VKREQLIRDLADRLGVPEHSAQVFLHAFFDAAKAALRTGDPLRIEGLGNWIPSLYEDGTLSSIEYVPVANEPAVAPVQGPVSSIDSMHFIPAAALESFSVTQNALIDVAEVVDEVQRQFTSGNGRGSAIIDPDSDSSTVPALSDVEDEDEPHDATDTIEIDEQPQEIAPDSLRDEDGSTEFETDQYTSSSVDDTSLSPAEDGVGIDTGEAFNGEDHEADPDHTMRAAPASTETTAPPGPETAFQDPDTDEIDDEDTEEEDNEVFYRNRDQLYHPPQERNTRPLLIVALVLTAVMIVIVLSMFFGEEERPVVPGAGESSLPVLEIGGQTAPA
jgi:hypothetical protein